MHAAVTSRAPDASHEKCDVNLYEELSALLRCATSLYRERFIVMSGGCHLAVIGLTYSRALSHFRDVGKRMKSLRAKKAFIYGVLRTIASLRIIHCVE